MPDIEKRLSRKGVVSYRVRVRLKGFPPITETFAKKDDARNWGQAKEAEMRQGKYFPETKAKTSTISDLIAAYLDDLEVKNPKRVKDVRKLLKWWIAEFGQLALADFKSHHVLKAQRLLLERNSVRKDENGLPIKITGQTVNRYTAALSTAFNFGIRRLKWISHNPVSDIDKFKEPPGSIRFLDQDEICRLLSACQNSQNPHLFNIVVIGLATGARRGEIERMRWEHVNPDATRIVLPQTKNGEVRAVYLEGTASQVVQKMRVQAKVCHGPLFPSPHNPEKVIDFRHAWEHALRVAKIEAFRFHDLRHSTASHLAMNGATSMEIADVLGHKTLSMVRRYTHLSTNHVSQVVATMTERILGHVEV